MVQDPPANAGNAGSIPGSGRSPGEGNGNPLQYSRLENPMDRGAWQATVHGITKGRRQLSSETTIMRRSNIFYHLRLYNEVPNMKPNPETVYKTNDYFDYIQNKLGRKGQHKYSLSMTVCCGKQGVSTK